MDFFTKEATERELYDKYIAPLRDNPAMLMWFLQRAGALTGEFAKLPRIVLTDNGRVLEWSR